MTPSDIADWFDIEAEWAKAASAYDGADRYTQAAATIRELEAANDIYRRAWCEEASKNNNLEVKLKIATEALEEIGETEGEINTSNYDHDDACNLNDRFVECLFMAEKALARIKEV